MTTDFDTNWDVPTTGSGKGRSFVFTWNTWDEDSEATLQGLSCKYLVYGYEIAPSTGRPHLQGYITFENPRHLSAIRGILPGAWVKRAKASATKNRTYCTKDGQYFEKGECPGDAASGGRITQQMWHDARTAGREGRFQDIPDELYVRYQASFKRMRKEDQPTPVDLPYSQKYGIWIYGPPRTGKSHRARHDYGPTYLKDINKWWDGYEHEENVLIDELAPDHAHFMVAFLKKWVDRWKFSAETKGGRSILRPQRIIVTSNYSIDEVFVNCSEVDKQAMLSRFEVIHMDGPEWTPTTEQSL